MIQPALSCSLSYHEPGFPEDLKAHFNRLVHASATTRPLQSEPSFSSPLPPRENLAASSWQLPVSAQSIPLRGRDLQVLTELFDLNEIEAIESDILQNLDWRCPEPCWEDDPFEFLQDYL